VNVKRIWEWYGIAVAFLIGLLLVLLIAFKVCGWFGADPIAKMLNGPTVGLLLAAIGLLAVVCVILSGKRPWEPNLKLAGKFLLLGGAVGLFLIGCALWIFWHSGRGTNAAQTIVISVQTLVLAITAGFVVWYAAAAQRQAEILKDQFDVLYRPHLRPEVFGPCPQTNYVGIRLMNLAGAAAIEPGVYPKWREPYEHKHNGRLYLKQSEMPNPPNPEDGFATCSVLQVGEKGHWCVIRPQEDQSTKVEVRWDNHPWEERKTHIWTLEPISKKEEEKGWHFAYHAEDNKPSP